MISVLCPTRGRRDDVMGLYHRMRAERAADVAKLRAVMTPMFPNSEGCCVTGGAG